MQWNIYQPMINEQRYHEVNRLDWSGVEWGSAYLKVTSALKGDYAELCVLNAVHYNLYEHTAIVEARDPEDLFHLTNMWDNEAAILWRNKPKSGSVGDVITTIDGETVANGCYICLSVGWRLASDDFSRWFQSKVTTHQMENAA